jgi:hypothetical protein
MILSQDIGYYQSQILNLNKLSKTVFYSRLQNTNNAIINNMNKHNKVESGCNSYASDVTYPCTELTTFKTSNLNERRFKWV